MFSAAIKIETEGKLNDEFEKPAIRLKIEFHLQCHHIHHAARGDQSSNGSYYGEDRIQGTKRRSRFYWRRCGPGRTRARRCGPASGRGWRGCRSSSGGTGSVGRCCGAQRRRWGACSWPARPPGGRVGSLMVGAADGLGGKLIRTVSFFGWTLPVSFLGGRRQSECWECYQP